MYFNLEKKYATRKNIREIRNKKGEIVTDPLEILKEFRAFYKDLYKKRTINKWVLEKLLANVAEQPIGQCESLLVCASPLRSGLILRIMGVSREEVQRTVYSKLAFLSELVHMDPWKGQYRGKDT